MPEPRWNGRSDQWHKSGFCESARTTNYLDLVIKISALESPAGEGILDHTIVNTSSGCHRDLLSFCRKDYHPFLGALSQSSNPASSPSRSRIFLNLIMALFAASTNSGTS